MIEVNDNRLVEIVTEVTNNRRFDLVSLSPDQRDALDDLRATYKSLESSLMVYVNDGRYKSICITKLEELALWINKVISRDFKEEKDNGETNDTTTKENT